MSLKINNDTANGSVTLQANNTATGDVVATLPPFSTELAPRMQLMTAQTASGTSVDFTGIPSWAKKITVMFNGVSTNGSSSPQVQIGSTTIQTSGYLAGTGYFLSGPASGSVGSTTGFPLRASPGSSDIHHGSLVLVNMGGNTWVATWVGWLSNNTTCEVGAGSVTLAGILNMIRITTVNGTDTFDAGTINILVEG